MLPYGKQSIDSDDIDVVVETLKSDFLTTGPKVAEFEAALCAATGAKEAVVCSNGTTALHLACLTLGLNEGDAVIVPSVTFLATANAVRYSGAEVIFSDVNPDSGLMETSHLEDAISAHSGKNIKAVFPVHLGGHCVDLKAVQTVAQKHGLEVITDSCHALGGEYDGEPIGSCTYEDMATFSFHPVKTIAMGEGGAITTNDVEWAKKMRELRTHGMIKTPEKGPWVYDMNEIGFNYRVSDIHCALGISQLGKLDQFVKRRSELAELYTELLKPLGNIILPPAGGCGSKTGWHLYAVRIDFEAAGLTRAKVMNALLEKGIGTQVHYIPVHTQPYYTDLYGQQLLSGAERYYSRTLSLPLYPDLKDEDVRYVVDTLKQIIEV